MKLGGKKKIKVKDGIWAGLLFLLERRSGLGSMYDKKKQKKDVKL